MVTWEGTVVGFIRTGQFKLILHKFYIDSPSKFLGKELLCLNRVNYASVKMIFFTSFYPFLPFSNESGAKSSKYKCLVEQSENCYSNLPTFKYNVLIAQLVVYSTSMPWVMSSNPAYTFYIFFNFFNL